jgi:hypothetical protein
MLEATGREFRRAHQFWSDEFAGLWSHADATTINVIYNEKTGRARLIDFEIIHHKSLPPTARQADDLSLFCSTSWQSSGPRMAALRTLLP